MTQPHILLHHINFHLSTGKRIFHELSFAFSQKKIGIVGRNGVGKSTLIKLLIGELTPDNGSLVIDGTLAHIPQNPTFQENATISDVLGFSEKLIALNNIMQGSINEQDYFILNHEWDIREQIEMCLSRFNLQLIPYDRHIRTLSGGEMTRLLLARVFSSHADFLLLDEPTNHLDHAARQQLYHAIQQWQGGLIIVSHDRTLLNLMEEMVELTTLGADCYGGNYDDYEEQKATQQLAKEQQLHDAKKLIKKTQCTIQASREKHEKKQSYGRELRRSKSIDKMAANSKQGRSEKTQSRMLIKNERLTRSAEDQLQSAKEKIEFHEEIKVNLPKTHVPNGKMILEIDQLTFSYPNEKPIINQFNLKLQGAERIALAGNNGSGKTTLVKLILQQLHPQSGCIHLGTDYVNYVDQQSALLDRDSSILDNFMRFNPNAKTNEAHHSLAQFLFKNTDALKCVRDLSGGEQLRALLACMFMSSHPPQLLILDEPTNHLDLASVKCIESVLRNYQGALIAISHDEEFLKQIGVEKIIRAPFE